MKTLKYRKAAYLSALALGPIFTLVTFIPVLFNGEGSEGGISIMAILMVVGMSTLFFAVPAIFVIAAFVCPGVRALEKYNKLNTFTLVSYGTFIFVVFYGLMIFVLAASPRGDDGPANPLLLVFNTLVIGVAISTFYGWVLGVIGKQEK